VIITGGVVRSQDKPVYGGGIYSKGKLTIRHGKVIVNIVECLVPDDLMSGCAYGGGICNHGDSARLTLIGSKVIGNMDV
jgi:hypothetical protein